MMIHNIPYSRCLRWFFRFRKRCGYGIHSPFAFNLVTGVIYENDAYYAYEVLKSKCTFRTMREKDCRLLFRLANYQQPRRAVWCGGLRETELAYLKSGKKDCKWRGYGEVADLCGQGNLPESSETLDLVYLDVGQELSQVLSRLSPCLSDTCLLIVRGIHSGRAAKQAWNRLQEQERVRVTFDLYDFGLVFYEPRLNKENYVINYF